jgi:hypothetical protein
MPYLTGVLTGILLTILVLFVIDNFGSDARPIVNWSVLSEKLGAAKEEGAQGGASGDRAGRPAERASASRDPLTFRRGADPIHKV